MTLRDTTIFETLSSEDQRKARQLQTKLEADSTLDFFQFGASLQSGLATLSHHMLEHIRKRDSDTLTEILTELIKKLEFVKPDELTLSSRSHPIKRFFRRRLNSPNVVLSKYQKLGAQIDKIAIRLNHHKKDLEEDNLRLQEFYNSNQQFFTRLTLYIAACELYLDKITEDTNTNPTKTRVNDWKLQVDLDSITEVKERLEQRLQDLMVSRQLTIQNAAQIRLLQYTNQVLLDKVQASILTSIPVWRNQLAVTLTLLRQKNGIEAQKQVRQAQNHLTKRKVPIKSAQPVSSLHGKNQHEIDSLKGTQNQLISTIGEAITLDREEKLKLQQTEAGLISALQQDNKR